MSGFPETSPSGVGLSPAADSNLENAIALGTVTLSAEEAAPRLGYKGRKGLERFRGACAAGVIPAYHDGKSYRVHWPSLVARLFDKTTRKP
jgi:hypothetical protein